MLRHPPTQADLLKADIDRLRDQRSAAQTRREEALLAHNRASALVEQADAAKDEAETAVETLGVLIDDALERLHRLLPRQENRGS